MRRPPFRRTPGRVATRRVVPWVVVMDVAREGQRHWTSRLSKRERRRLVALVRQSRGRTSTLAVGEQRELRRLVDQLDLRSFARHAAVGVVAGTARRPRGRGR